MENYTEIPQQEIRASIVDRCLERRDFDDMDKLALAGVALEITRMLQENGNAIEDVRSGRRWNFPHEGIGIPENPSPKTRAVMIKMFPLLAREVFDKYLEDDNL